MLPTMKIGDLEITRLIVGSNPFTGKSHLDENVDADMKDYFTDEAAFAMLDRCWDAGINAVQSRGAMPIMGLIHRYRQAGGKLQWIATSAKNLITFDEELDEMMKYDPVAICIHGELADDLYMSGNIPVNISAGALETLHSQAYPIFRNAITDTLHNAMEP